MFRKSGRLATQYAHRFVDPESFIGKNTEKRAEALRQCGLWKFERAAVHLSEVWLGEAEHTDLTKRMERYILSSGVYGSIENWALVGSEQRKDKKCMAQIMAAI